MRMYISDADSIRIREISARSKDLEILILASLTAKEKYLHMRELEHLRTEARQIINKLGISLNEKESVR